MTPHPRENFNSGIEFAKHSRLMQNEPDSFQTPNTAPTQIPPCCGHSRHLTKTARIKHPFRTLESSINPTPLQCELTLTAFMKDRKTHIRHKIDNCHPNSTTESWLAPTFQTSSYSANTENSTYKQITPCARSHPQAPAPTKPVIEFTLV